MKIVLVDKSSDRRVNKDQMGGYGIDTQVGQSFLARWLMRRKKDLRNIPVLSLVYLAGIFSKGGHEVKVLDSDIIPPADLFIIVSSIVDYKSELQLASKIRKESPKSKIGFIGPFAAFLSEVYLQYGDFVIKGEPEYIAMKISKNYIPAGVVDSLLIKNLDELPFPDWEFFPINEYSYFPNLNKKPFLTMQSSRGCAFGCNYCPYLYYQHVWRPRSIEKVIEEIRYLKDRFALKSLLFRDPLFTLDKNRSREIARRILNNRFNIEWSCETRTDLLDEDSLSQMADAGLKSINLGIESAWEDLLTKATRKAVDLKYQERILRHCEKKGIKVTAFYLLGLPGSTPETEQGTIRFAKKLNTFVAQFHVFTPFPGTELYWQIKDKIVVKEWEQFNSFTPVIYNGKLSREEISRLKERAFVTYYFRPSYVMKHAKYILSIWKELLLT